MISQIKVIPGHIPALTWVSILLQKLLQTNCMRKLLVNKTRQTDYLFNSAYLELLGERKSLVIFLFHVIFRDENEARANIVQPPQGITLEHFSQFIEYYQSHNYVFVSPDDILDGLDSSRNYALITFDDGYAGVYEHGLRILMEYEYPSTIYLTTDAIGGSSARNSSEFPGLYPGERMLTWPQVRELSRNGFTPGGHMKQHLDITTCNPDAATEQLVGSKAEIEQRIGVPCASFAYPWGRYDTRSKKLVAGAGYRNAVTAIHGPVRPHEDLFAIPRIDIRRDYSRSDFEASLRGDWDFLGWYQQLRRKVYG